MWVYLDQLDENCLVLFYYTFCSNKITLKICIKLVLINPYIMMHGNTKLKKNGKMSLWSSLKLARQHGVTYHRTWLITIYYYYYYYYYSFFMWNNQVWERSPKKTVIIGFPADLRDDPSALEIGSLGRQTSSFQEQNSREDIIQRYTNIFSPKLSGISHVFHTSVVFPEKYWKGKRVYQSLYCPTNAHKL